jgi:hypothetical protein
MSTHIQHQLSIVEAEPSPLELLPPARTRHWTPRHKSAVVAAVREGFLSLSDAFERYMLTEEEFYEWKDAIEQHGEAGLHRNMRADRRRATRQAISEPALVSLNSDDVACFITDISDYGARLQFEHPISAPLTLELRCQKSGRSWWVTVVWRRHQAIGVRFNNPLHPPWVIKSGLAGWLLGRRRTVSIDRLGAR